ncbi:DUF5361 domain-containing protein [Nocardia sp. CA-136227]|uniref:DUF5361 domain-containing protein n=1 Tax=Nocardia sp. CA-136227 TaxID=3239979 RepID=UPI003D97A68A
MARAFGNQPGGILSLDALLEEHSEAIEYDLIALGLRLRQLSGEALSWRDLWAIVKFLPPDSALMRTMHPEDHRWRLEQHLLAEMTDCLRWLVWSKSDDARNGRNRPERISRPGLESDRERVGTAVGVDRINEFLGWSE